MGRLQRIPGAGEVQVVLGFSRQEVVVRSVVDTPEAQGWAKMVAFAGVVVDHIQQHFDSGGVERLHHLLELGNLVAAGGGVAGMWREEAEGVVAPVVG